MKICFKCGGEPKQSTIFGWVTACSLLLYRGVNQMGKDNFFKVRMTDEQVQTLEGIVKEIQADTPEANVTASSVARYALEKYIDDYRAKKSGKNISITADISNQNLDDVIRLYQIFINTLQRDGRRLGVTRRYRENHKEQYEAQMTVYNALKTGNLIRPKLCEECGKVTKNIEAHHEDYSKKLEVKWLCFSCHAKTRRKYPREEDER